MIGHVVRGFLPVPDLLTYLDSVLRVYNQLGRRDNLYKARIKILVHETGVDEFTASGRGRVCRHDPGNTPGPARR